MLKILKNIKEKTESKIQKYTQENINELSRIINRPKEGEIIKISNIKIQESFKRPKSQKIKQRRKYYEKYNYFRSTIVLSQDNYLLDGYTTYLLAKEMKFDYITIVRAR